MPREHLAAFELAVQQNADAIELDTKLTADGHVVVIHDQTVDRTTEGTVKCANCLYRNCASWMPAPISTLLSREASPPVGGVRLGGKAHSDQCRGGELRITARYAA